MYSSDDALLKVSYDYLIRCLLDGYVGRLATDIQDLCCMYLGNLNMSLDIRSQIEVDMKAKGIEYNRHSVQFLGDPLSCNNIEYRLFTNGYEQEIIEFENVSLTYSIIVDGRESQFELLTRKGQEEFTALQHHWIRESEAFVLCYSIDSMATFNNIQRLWQRIWRIKDEEPVNAILVGHTNDNSNTREVPNETGQSLADSYGIPFIEASTINNQNIEQILEILTRNIRKIKLQQYLS